VMLLLLLLVPMMRLSCWRVMMTMQLSSVTKADQTAVQHDW
jgi:hypothetical protein